MLLKMPSSTANCAVRWDCGILPVKADIISRNVNFWTKLRDGKCGSLQTICYEYQKQNKSNQWLGKFERELQIIGLGWCVESNLKAKEIKSM